MFTNMEDIEEHIDDEHEQKESQGDSELRKFIENWTWEDVAIRLIVKGVEISWIRILPRSTE